MKAVFQKFGGRCSSQQPGRSLPADGDSSPRSSEMVGVSRPQDVQFWGGTSLVSMLLLILFLAVILGLHAASFDGPMYYDSAARLQEKSYRFHEGLSAALAIFPQRPLAMLTFYLNYVYGGMNSSYFRLINAVILAFTAVIVVRVLVTIQLIDNDRDGTFLTKWTVASSLGLFFAAHPLQVYVVDYIWQRAALLSCLFYLSSFGFYLAARTGRIRNSYLRYGMSLLAFGLSLASKENAVTLPVVLIIAEVAFFRQSLGNLRNRTLILLGAGFIAAGLLSLLESPHGLGKTSGILNTVSDYYGGSGLSLLPVFLTQCRMVFSYPALIFLPSQDNIRLISPQLISYSITDPPITLIAVMGICLLAGVSIFLLKRRPVSGFGLLFFLVNLVPESFLVPQYLFVPYRALLPMVGVLMVVGDAVLWLIERSTIPRTRRMVCGALIAVFLPAMILVASVTASKAHVWRNPLDFWKEEMKGLPLSAKNLEPHGTAQILSSLAVNLQRAKQTSEAIPLLEKALRITPADGRILLQLAHAHAEAGDFQSATACLRKAREMEPDSAEVHWSFGHVMMLKGSTRAALHHYEEAVSKGKGDPEFDDSLGTCLLKLGDYDRSVESYQRALVSEPSRLETKYRLSKALMKAGRTSHAASQLRDILEAKPTHWKAHNDLGVLLAHSGRPDEAAIHFSAALKINPDDLSIRKNLETALVSMQKDQRNDRDRAGPHGK